jgi:hypothetical protein
MPVSDIQNIGNNDNSGDTPNNFANGNSDALKSKQMDIDAGWLGKFFGNSSNAPTNIAGITIFLMIGIPFVSDLEWEQSLPIITLALGYIFGKNT